ncbi:hypothetical protein BC943DRAFT_329970 [Umbelopsis sp. AD052]|nr:hypothetical protein BC943DRAFT_329970 [Umbelopsis sp. AD052]
MLETLWSLTGLVISSPGHKELPKTIVTKAFIDNSRRLPVIKEEYTTEDSEFNIKTEKISVQLVEEDDDQDSVFLDMEEEFSPINVEERDLPPLPLSPAEEESSAPSHYSPMDIEILTHVDKEQKAINASEWVVAQWDSVIQPSPPAALACCSPDEIHSITSDKIRTATLPHLGTPRPSLIRDSVVVPRTKDIDRYRILYKIKYDNRKSKDSWLTMDGRISTRLSRSGMPLVKQFWHGFKEGKGSNSQLPFVRQRRNRAKGQYFFWAGFACPIIWVIGTWYLEKTASSADDLWRRRCSRAAMLTTVLAVCCLIVFFVVHPSIFVPRMSFKPPVGTTVVGLDE